MTTVDFTISPTAYLNHIVSGMAARYWWLLIAPVGLIVYGAVVDYRFIIVGLTTLFIVYPMLMTLAILRYAADPKVVARASANVAEIDGTVLTLFRVTVDPDSERRNITEVLKASSPAIEVSNRMILFRTGPALTDFFLLPRNSLTSEQIGRLEAELNQFKEF